MKIMNGTQEPKGGIEPFSGGKQTLRKVVGFGNGRVEDPCITSTSVKNLPSLLLKSNTPSRSLQ